VASHGFVTFAIDTNTTGDFPPSRGDQILAALDYLTQRSSVVSRIDTSRLAVAGHSMGGGGTLEAANDRPSLQAAVPLQPWHSTKSWSNIRVPTMIIGAESDSIAPVSSHAEPFYQSMTSAPEKAYVELNGESHMAAATNPADQAYAMVSWLKRFVDDDTRYEAMLCPPPTSSDYSEWRNTCPGPGGGTTPPPTTTPPPPDECEWWEWWC
jgi:pimeloyl-ACP methyl ester carboxylesterase